MAGSEPFSGARADWRDTDATCIDVGLINNMPDAALQATERQFRSLLAKASPAGVNVRLTFYWMPEVPRTDVGAERVRRLYTSSESIGEGHLDGLIVTGAEPKTPQLKDEPYWTALTQLLDWARDNTDSTILSCLAAHAGVLHLDGIERRLLPDKRFGLFEAKPTGDHQLTPQLRGARIPHSRWNELPEEQLVARGYRVLTRSDEAGADTFVKDLGARSLFVFLQGHPEYEADTLLLEYRRDVKRFLTRERNTYPLLPRDYFDDELAATLLDLQRRAEADRREELISEFPTELALRRVANSWRPAAIEFYRNWLGFLHARKEQRAAAVAHSAALVPSLAPL